MRREPPSVFIDFDEGVGDEQREPAVSGNLFIIIYYYIYKILSFNKDQIHLKLAHLKPATKFKIVFKLATKDQLKVK